MSSPEKTNMLVLRLTQSNAARVQSALVAGHGVLVASDAADLQNALGSGPGEARTAHVYQRQVHVGTTCCDVVATRF